MKDKPDIDKLFQTRPFSSLFDSTTDSSSRRWKKMEVFKDTSKSAAPVNNSPGSKLTPDARLLGNDSAINPFEQFNQRQERLGWSVRRLETAKQQLIRRDLIRELRLGKSLFLVPTSPLYDLLELESPYPRNVSDIHSFCVLLTAHLVQHHPLVDRVKCEVSLGDANSTVDVVAYLKNGLRWAYEITISVSNVSANAGKLQKKGFTEIYFVCPDYKTKEAVWAHLRNSGLPGDYLATIRCIIFSTLLRQKKAMTPRS